MLGGSTWWEQRISHVSYHHIYLESKRYRPKLLRTTGTSLMPPEAKLTLWLDQFHSFLKSAVEIIAICYNRAGAVVSCGFLAVLTSVIWEELVRWSSQENWVTGIPSRELTYPTLGKGKSSSNMPFGGDMLVPWRVDFPKKSQANWRSLYSLDVFG